MTKPNAPLSLQEMKQFGNAFGDDQALEFDFSSIPFSYYKPFFQALPNIVYKKATKLTFATKLLKEFQKTNNPKNMKKVENSIAVKNLSLLLI
jgi:ABC-type sugar transport system substrate-binding protein